MTLALSYPDLAGLYDRLAPEYDRLHQRWLRLAGGEAQAALEAAVRVFARPEARLLDAGCGTGAFARRLVQEEMITPDRLTLLDPSTAMLQRCSDIPCERTCGRLEAIPFAPASFDVVTCAWVLETTTHPVSALAEMQRVLRSGGWLCLAFCADRPVQGMVHKALRRALTLRGTGRFLCETQLRATVLAAEERRVISVPVTGPVAVMFVQKRR